MFVLIGTDCFSPYDTLGIFYNGLRQYTASGKVCMDWRKTFGALHNYSNMVSEGVFCRNPNSRTGGPWCFIDDKTGEWEYCGIHPCGMCSEDLRLLFRF